MILSVACFKAIKFVLLVRVTVYICVCACLTKLSPFVGFFVSISESEYIGLGELLSSGAFTHKRTGIPAY